MPVSARRYHSSFFSKTVMRGAHGGRILGSSPNMNGGSGVAAAGAVCAAPGREDTSSERIVVAMTRLRVRAQRSERGENKRAPSEFLKNEPRAVGRRPIRPSSHLAHDV